MELTVMSDQELHLFGMQVMLPQIEKEGFTIEHINKDIQINPQIIGKRWGSLGFIYLRTACYPDTGNLTEEEFMQGLEWAKQNSAIPFFAGVRVTCVSYPDKSPVVKESDKGIPYRFAEYEFDYTGLHIMTTEDHVKIIRETDL